VLPPGFARNEVNVLEKIRERLEGQGLVEYALILILVAIVVIVVLALLGPAIGNVFSIVVGALTYDGDGSLPDVPPDEPPPECYGSLLLPALIGITGLGVGFSHLLPRKAPAKTGTLPSAAV
jgi:pilus assembly protein Flp/PilA